MPYLIVFLGAGLGGALRHGVNTIAARWFGLEFPYGTLTINVAGSLAMGLLTGYFVARSGLPQELKLFLTTGILGGFTTFSTFSLDTVTLWQRGPWTVATGYVAASLVLSITALAAGAAVVRLLTQGPL